jgi:hypothetical protein
MKPRHAAALALVLWCLILPREGVDVSASSDFVVSDWVPYGKPLKSKEDCQTFFVHVSQMLKAPGADRVYPKAHASHEQFESFRNAVEKYARCIGTNDPRFVGPN